MPPRTPRTTRKLLVASIGVATMSYVVYSCASTANGNDAAADVQRDAVNMNDIPVANLVAPPVDAHDDTMQMEDIPVANLVAPPVDAAD